MTEQQLIRNLEVEAPGLAAIHRKQMETVGNMPTDEALLLVGAHDHYNVDGSQRFPCDCGKYFWLTPSSVELLRTHTGNVKKMCVTCALALWRAK